MNGFKFRYLLAGILTASLVVTAACTQRDDERREAVRNADNRELNSNFANAPRNENNAADYGPGENYNNAGGIGGTIGEFAARVKDNVTEFGDAMMNPDNATDATTASRMGSAVGNFAEKVKDNITEFGEAVVNPDNTTDATTASRMGSAVGNFADKVKDNVTEFGDAMMNPDNATDATTASRMGSAVGNFADKVKDNVSAAGDKMFAPDNGTVDNRSLIPLNGAAGTAALYPADKATGGVAASQYSGSDNGEYLARAAGCRMCHTYTEAQKDSEPSSKIYLGDKPLTEGQFFRAVRNGTAPAGYKIPLMPWEYYAYMTDGDVASLYDYYMKTSFPDEKIVMEKDLVKGKTFVAANGKSPDYARGAYLVEVLGHCGQCHSPRDVDKPLSGGYFEDEWVAYNITSDPDAGIGKWTREELARYLHDGVVPGKGNAVSGMGLVVENSTHYLTDADRRAIASYLKQSAPYSDGQKKARFEWGTPLNDVDSIRTPMVRLDNNVNRDGKTLYNGYCASCHGYKGTGTDDGQVGGFPSLVHNSTVGAETVNNVLLMVLHGSERFVGNKEAFMPAVGSDLSDEEVATIADFVTGHFGNPAVSVNVSEIKKMR